jgi:elongation factor Ts
MSITASQVKELREKTGVGMMKCKKILIQANGDIEKAIELLRKEGAAVAAKKAGREATEGKVFFATVGSITAAVEVFCETEPTSANNDYKAFGEAVANIAATENISDREALLASALNGSTVQEELNVLVGRITENIGIKRIAVASADSSEALATYSHMGGKIGVIVKLKIGGEASDTGVINSLAKDLCMQTAATAPVAVRSDDISEEYIAKELEIYKELALKAGTKEEFVDRQVQGKLKKHLKEVCLEEQMFVKDNKKPITTLLKEVASEAGAESVAIDSFTRIELGK